MVARSVLDTKQEMVGVYCYIYNIYIFVEQLPVKIVQDWFLFNIFVNCYNMHEQDATIMQLQTTVLLSSY